ncbi:MAG: prohibitin family protein [Flavobacteriales bacterium]|jgi:regulator of protease activity HflC (stomatin/prohibitin superfamily)|nr:prohibitin family protein [Flavobacteriales bacterium]MDC3389666.1 prohibitin family protein [Flavobacteriales bacterium]MDG1239177.1 prohibitin family protein [Flavobacteriales bacterium]MDG1441025.1 prohibitin family protein [Flavobacteriales bacterium]MDG1798812.1 prohibitin family protein [Flavobacteriales bacterium]
MSEIEIEPKNILKTALAGGLGVILLSLFFMSWTDVNPGEEGFIYRPYTGGIEQNAVYTEGTVFIAPWNEMITYNILQQSRNYSSKVMEKNGMEIGIDVTINYNPMQNNTAKLHLKHGKAFESSFIDAKVRGVIKDVIGRYTYEEIYSTKREALETEMDTIFQSEFPANFISYNFCEIADVNLPENVKVAITEKETQKQRNQKAKELEEEQQYLANAEIMKAEGEKKAAILRAQGRAEEIRLVQQQLTRSPNYIELVKWKGYADGKGSPYGQDNVFGAGTSVIKGLK